MTSSPSLSSWRLIWKRLWAIRVNLRRRRWLKASPAVFYTYFGVKVPSTCLRRSNIVDTSSAAAPDQSAADRRWQRSAAASSNPVAQGWAGRSSGLRSPWRRRPFLTGSPDEGTKSRWGNLWNKFIISPSRVPTFLLKSSLLSMSCSLVTSCFMKSEFRSVESDKPTLSTGACDCPVCSFPRLLSAHLETEESCSGNQNLLACPRCTSQPGPSTRHTRLF